MDPIIQLGWRGAVGEGAQLILNSFTLPVMEHARSSGLLSLMDDKLHLKMKTVKYSWQDKLRELMCSIVAGCEHTVSINHRLVPDTTLASELIGKERFADQSGINRLLHAFAEENLDELEEIYRARLHAARHSGHASDRPDGLRRPRHVRVQGGWQDLRGCREGIHREERRQRIQGLLRIRPRMQGGARMRLRWGERQRDPSHRQAARAGQDEDRLTESKRDRPERGRGLRQGLDS